jgi:hypothetical protein
MNCRHCNSELTNSFLDLGFAPPSNAYIGTRNNNTPEIYYPLKIMVCNKCWLVQTEDYARFDELFSNNYAYFSSASETWTMHAKHYTQEIISQLKLNTKSLVIEIASNDGYLLRNFTSNNIPCIGIEPTDSTANAAEKIGIPTIREFFGLDLAKDLSKKNKKADLICGNNVYAHVPNINDFTRGIKWLLKDDGVVTLEFPHLMKMIQGAQFDTAYHEHFSYLSLSTVERIFSKCGLRVWDVKELSTHGGSIRVYGCHDTHSRKTNKRVEKVIKQEMDYGMNNMSIYESFQQSADSIKNSFLEFLIQKKRDNKTVVAYGAAAKGNTLFNYAGIKNDLISFVCDIAPSKQGKYLPGSHIPILKPKAILSEKPDFVIISPWNIASEVVKQHSYISEWGGKFVVVIPKIKIIT